MRESFTLQLCDISLLCRYITSDPRSFKVRVPRGDPSFCLIFYLTHINTNLSNPSAGCKLWGDILLTVWGIINVLPQI